MGEQASSNSTGICRFNWQAFDAAAGTKYVVGVVTIYILGGWLSFPWFTAGICALLAWLTDVPGKRVNRVLGMVAFGVASSLLTLLYHALGGDLVLQIIAVFVVTFAGTLLMLRGARAYMVGWSCIYWFLLVPLFSDLPTGPMPTVLSINAGVAVVVTLTLLGGLFGKSIDESPVADAPQDTGLDIGFVTGFSITLAIAMAVGLWIGGRFFETDPTLVAGAAFMVVGMSSRQTWIAGIERATGAILGIIVGFYLFQFVSDEFVLFALGVVLSFLCMALMNVNPAAFVFFFLIYISHGWVSQGLERASLIANERILAELVGVVLAGLAVSGLVWWAGKRQITEGVDAQQSGF